MSAPVDCQAVLGVYMWGCPAERDVVLTFSSLHGPIQTFAHSLCLCLSRAFCLWDIRLGSSQTTMKESLSASCVSRHVWLSIGR